MRCAHVFLSATVVMGVAACSQDSPPMSERLSNVTANSSVAQDMNATVNLSDFERSAGRKPVPVVVEGNAFGLDQAVLERQVAYDMKGAYWGPRANFIPAAQARTMPDEPEYLVVMQLNPAGQPARQVTGAQLCAEQYRTAAVGSPLGANTNVTTGPTPPRGSTNPAMRNDSADTTNRPAVIGQEDLRRNYNLPRESDVSSSARSDAAAAVARQNQVNSANASTSVARGSTNPAMRNDSAATEDRPAPIGREDELRNTRVGQTTTSSTSATGSARGSSGAAAPASRSAATSSTRTRAATSAAARNSVHLVSALCHYDQAVQQVDTRAANIRGTNDPAFHNLIVSATNQLTQPLPVPADRPAEPGQER